VSRWRVVQPAGGMLRVLSLTVVAGLLVGTAAAVPTSSPMTLVSVNESIDAFAQDGGRVAWISECGYVRIRTLATGAQVTLGEGNLWGERGCLETQLGEVLALAGKRAVWGGFGSGGNFYAGGVATGAPGEHPKSLVSLTGRELWGDYLMAAAQGGSALFYSTVTVTHTPEDDNQCYYHPPCLFSVTGGGIERVVGRSMLPSCRAHRRRLRSPRPATGSPWFLLTGGTPARNRPATSPVRQRNPTAESRCATRQAAR